jgi:hypothetical protein
MLVCFFIQFLTKGSRSIYKIVAKIKEAMVAFVHHCLSKIVKLNYTNKKIPPKKSGGTFNDCLPY